VGTSFAWVSMKVAKFGHVQRQPGRVEPELGDHAAGKPGLDLAQLQLPLTEAVHRVPEPTVIHRGPVQPHPPRGCDQDMR
jgi:hypothetical protein